MVFLKVGLGENGCLVSSGKLKNEYKSEKHFIWSCEGISSNWMLFIIMFVLDPSVEIVVRIGCSVLLKKKLNWIPKVLKKKC